MKKIIKILALLTSAIMLIVSVPVLTSAQSKNAETAFDFSGSSFVSSDWSSTNNSPSFTNDGIWLAAVNNKNYATVTYKDKFNLTKGFELTYSATGRYSYNNIYDGTYYVGVKIGNITVAMDQYVKPVIMVNDTVKTKGDAIISYSTGANISTWVTSTESQFSVKYVASYDYDSKTLTYAKYHDDTKAFEISYTDTAGLIDLSNASVSLYHNNSYNYYATYKGISLDILSGVPDFATLPGGACGEKANWAFDESTGTLYIYGEGKMNDYINVGNVAPWKSEYRTKITKIIIGDDITYIGNRAFKGLNYVTAVKFGKNVQSTGYELFFGCTKLENAQLNEGLTKISSLTFYNCTALKQIVIPSTVTKLSNRAFKGTGLTSVVVPDTVTYMGYEVFMNCANLASVDFTESLSMLQPCTFMNCTSLTEFYFTDNMCRIRPNAFSGCTALKSVYFEDDTKMWGSTEKNEAKISSNAFDGCAATLELIGTLGGHLEKYASLRGFTFVDKDAKVEVDHNGNAPEGYEKYSGTRNAWLWPFSATSIWNMPIGSDAKLEKANFKSEYCVSTDDEYHVIVPEGSPTVDVYSPSSWQTRWPGSRKLGTMQIPADFYLADATSNSTPNNCAAFLMPDSRTIRQLEPCCRLETGNARIVGYLHSEDQDIYGDGIKGTHYGSGLSAIGGSIRKGELTSDEPIRHALKLNVYAKNYLYYDTSAKKGYVWPADRHDSYAASGNNAYGGSNPKLRMGTLLTIPQNVTAESLGIKTQVGKKLFYALQNYGCYIVDDSAWSCYAWSTEDGVRDEVEAKYGYSLNTNSGRNSDYYKDAIALITNLYIVTNSSPTTIGGGGTPCKPLAPDFE